MGFVLVLLCLLCLSSRRRHTRSKRDWSSDVCSSDLRERIFAIFPGYFFILANFDIQPVSALRRHSAFIDFVKFGGEIKRSEERRVGKECRYIWCMDLLEDKKSRD